MTSFSKTGLKFPVLSSCGNNRARGETRKRLTYLLLLQIHFHIHITITISSSSMVQTFRHGSRMFKVSNCRGLIDSSATTISKHSQKRWCSKEPLLPKLCLFCGINYMHLWLNTVNIKIQCVLNNIIVYLASYAARPLWWSKVACKRTPQKSLGIQVSLHVQHFLRLGSELLRSWW